MTADPIPEPPSSAAFPALDETPRAGSPAEQIALQDSAREMVEVFQSPNGYRSTRLSNAWLGERDWRVQLVSYHDLEWEDGLHDGLIAAARRRGHSFLLGTAVSPHPRPTAVWRLPLEEEKIQIFFNAHIYNFSVVFPPDRSFAVQGNDGYFSVYAGPEAFLREALPPERIGPAATAAVVAEVENEHGEGSMQDVLDHYEPFMLDG